MNFFTTTEDKKNKEYDISPILILILSIIIATLICFAPGRVYGSSPPSSFLPQAPPVRTNTPCGVLDCPCGCKEGLPCTCKTPFHNPSSSLTSPVSPLTGGVISDNRGLNSTLTPLTTPTYSSFLPRPSPYRTLRGGIFKARPYTPISSPAFNIQAPPVRTYPFQAPYAPPSVPVLPRSALGYPGFGGFTGPSMNHVPQPAYNAFRPFMGPMGFGVGTGFSGRVCGPNGCR